MEKGEEGGLYNAAVSPVGRIFLSEAKRELVILGFVTFERPVDVAAVKSAMKIPLSHCPLLRSIPESRKGRMHWKEQPEIDIDNHMVIVPEQLDIKNEQDEKRETYINAYVAAVSSWPAMSRDKPLWEVHILPPRTRCIVLRLHHALGDCLSLLSLFLAGCDSSKDPACTVIPKTIKENKKSKLTSLGVWKRIKIAWRMLLISIFEARHVLYRIEDKTPIAGEPGVELLPRKLGTLTLSLDDMIIVKNKVNAKINDVYGGIVAYGVVKYMRLKYPQGFTKDTVISIGNAFSIREEGAKELVRSIKEGKDIKWGNLVTILVTQMKLACETNDPLQYVRNVRDILNKKKKSNDALLSFKLHRLFPQSGGKMPERMYNRMVYHTSLGLSNIMGPSDPVYLKGNQVTRIGVTISKMSIALQVHMITYNQKAFLQFIVAAEIIPDPELLCCCVDEALSEMKVAALNSTCDGVK